MNRISELRAMGLNAAQIQRIRRQGNQVTWGVYAEPGLDPQARYLLKCRSVLERLQPSAALAGPSAAAVWELPIVGEPPDEVYVRNIPRGAYAQDVRVLSDAPSQMVGDLNVTTPVWTAIDCARMLNSRDGLIVADAALAGSLFTTDALVAAADGIRGHPGASRARWIAAHVDPLSESPGETWARSLVSQLGYDVSSQAYVTDGRREAWLDLLLDDGRTAIEFDGLVKYKKRGLAKVIQEHLRDGDLQAIGYTLLHVIWKQLSDPGQLDRRLRYAGARPARPPRLLTW